MMILTRQAKKRLETLAQALDNEQRLHELLPGGFDMNYGTMVTDCGTRGCIAGMAYIMAIGPTKARDMEKETEEGDELASFWDVFGVLNTAMSWITGKDRTGSLYRPGSLPPLFSDTDSGETADNYEIDHVTPGMAAMACRIVARAGVLDHNPWPEVMERMAIRRAADKRAAEAVK